MRHLFSRSAAVLLVCLLAEGCSSGKKAQKSDDSATSKAAGSQSSDDEATARGSTEEGQKPALADSKQIPVGDSPVRGPDDALVTIVEFSDYQCPYCQRAEETISELREEYPDQVRVVFKQYPLPMHQQANAASRAALAAGKQGKYWEMHDLLFSYQKVMRGKSDQEMKEWTAGFAGELGLDVAQFKEDFDSKEVRRQIERDKKLAEKLRVRGTPHFFANGVRIKGAKEYAHFEEVVEKQLDKAEDALADGVAPVRIYKAMVAENFDKPEPRPEPRKPRKPDVKVSMVPIEDNDPVRGNTQDPLVTIVAFSDFQCPFCNKAVPTLEKIAKNYDEVRIVFKQLPLPMHKTADIAAEASLAAHEQGKFWEMHDKLFAEQKTWANMPEKDFLEWVEEAANDIGIDGAKVARAVEDDKYEDEVRKEVELAGKVGARGTPNFWVNGVNVVGAKPYASFASVIDEQIAKAKKLQKKKGVEGDALYKAMVARNRADAPDPKPKARKPKPDKPAPNVDTSNLTIDDDQVTGAKDAEVTVYMFADYQCPYCNKGWENLFDAIDETDVSVRVVYKHFPLPFHKQARQAARAAMAAGEQGKFWEMSEQLFDNQRRLKQADIYKELAKKIGLDVNEFENDMGRKAFGSQIEKDMEQGRSIGVRGTPAFFINGARLVGAQPKHKFKSAIEDAADQ